MMGLARNPVRKPVTARSAFLICAIASACALVLLGAGNLAQSQRRKKTLVAGDKMTLSFADLIEAHLGRALGNLSRLPMLGSGAPMERAVYITITTHAIFIWDAEVVELGDGGAVPKQLLANCPPACIPTLRDAVSGALSDEIDRLRATGETPLPRVLLLADKSIPYRTFLAAAYSIARATAGRPPEIALGVLQPGGSGSVAAIPLLLAPPHPVRIAENANPLLIHVSLQGSAYRVVARKAWLPEPETVATSKELRKLLGEIKARDPVKTVAFVSASPDLPLEQVVKLIGVVRALYPDVTLGGRPEVIGPAQ